MLVIGPGPDNTSENNTPNTTLDMINEIKSLKDSTIEVKREEKDPIILTNVVSDIAAKKKEKKKKKKEKKKIESESNKTVDIDADILDIESFIRDNLADEEAIDESIISTQKKGYNRLKKSKNEYKKEFSEELTLLYNLLDETSTFGKQLEKDLQAIRGTKVRGVTKYSNDLAELVLTSKQNKLSILKEIAGIKKTIADLKLKADAKNNKNDDVENSNEQLASFYLKNILNHGRSEFINNMTNDSSNAIDFRPYGDNSYQDDEDMLFNELESRLEYSSNPNRSDEGNKYIEYENRGVHIYIKKCIDTGEWEFVAIDKNKQQIYDYPLPAKRDVGRVRFSDDGTYATDAQGRMYKVLEYYLPDDE